jgi:hypothetical protein
LLIPLNSSSMTICCQNFQALKIPGDEKPCNKEPLNGHYEPTPTSAPSTRCLS